jgi:hypothetical protein
VREKAGVLRPGGGPSAFSTTITTRAAGIEPAIPTRETDRIELPYLLSLVLSHAKVVELWGFEPQTPCVQSRCSPN